MSEDGKPRAPGFTSDLAFSFGTYLMLATILGICSIVLRPLLQPLVGALAASVW
jgi:hypothetical protein